MHYRRAINTGSDDPHTSERLSGRAREAERILDQSLDAARGAAPGPVTSLETLRTQVESRARRLTASQENTIMSAITKPLHAHRKLSFGVVFAVLVFAFATLVPFEYQRTIGYQATYAGIDPAAGISLDRLESTLLALGYDDAEFGLQTSDNGITYRISSLPSRFAVRAVTAAMAGMTGFTGEPEITPLVETVSGSLYAQVKCELGDLDDIKFEGKTDDEIKSEIKKRLADHGCPDATVEVRTLDDYSLDDKREIVIKVKDGPGPDAGFLCNGLFLEDLDLNDSSKTDAELKEYIERRLEAAGKSNVDVSVKTRPDGKRRIELKCKPN